MRAASRLLALTASVNVQNGCLRSYLRSAMTIRPESDRKDFDYSRTLLDAFISMLKVPAPREVFAFSGQAFSGVSLVGKVSIPESGYCFFGWIRLERTSEPELRPVSMCVFRFATAEGCEVELSVVEKRFVYTVRGEGDNPLLDSQEPEDPRRTHRTQRPSRGGHLALRRTLPPEQRFRRKPRKPPEPSTPRIATLPQRKPQQIRAVQTLPAETRLFRELHWFTNRIDCG